MKKRIGTLMILTMAIVIRLKFSLAVFSQIF